MKVLDFIIDYWPLLSPVILEIILRLTPTGKDLSVISNIVKLLDKIIPNIRKPKGDEGIAEFDEKGNALNNVKVRTDRFVKTILLLFVFGISLNVANAQTWQNFKGVRLVNELQDTSALYPVEGSLYYNYGLHTFYGRTQYGWKPFSTSTFLNTVPNGELIGSNGTIGVPSHLRFDATGSMTLGNSADGGLYRTLYTDGSAGDIGFEISLKSSAGTRMSFGGSPLDQSFQMYYSTNGGNNSIEFFGEVTDSLYWLPNEHNALTISGGFNSTGSDRAANVIIQGGHNFDTGIGGDVILKAGSSVSGSSGRIILIGIPTSAVGLPSGAIWSNAGVLTIVP